MTPREQDAAFREAFEDVNNHARAIANHVVAGVPVPDGHLDAYAQAQGRLDRALDLIAGVPEAIR